MDITVREMETSEARQVKALGRRAFSLIEGLWIGSPKAALVAVTDGRIVGALIYKFYYSGGKKVGYVDYVFTDPDYHGMGIGKTLYREGCAYLWAKGADALTALVKDDNVASWSLFLKNGFSRVSFPRLVGEFGLPGALRQYFTMPYFISVGMDYYVALRDRDCPSGKDSGGVQMVFFLLVNLALAAVMLLRVGNAVPLFAACAVMLCGEMLTGFAGTLFSRRKWTFRFPNGGAVVTLLVNLFAFYPMIGRWYPKEYENTPAFRRDMGVNALVPWMFTLAVAGAALLLQPANGSVFRMMGEIAAVFSVYRSIAVYPMEPYGGMRVFRWNRAVFAVMAAASLLVVVPAWFF